MLLPPKDGSSRRTPEAMPGMKNGPKLKIKDSRGSKETKPARTTATNGESRLGRKSVTRPTRPNLTSLLPSAAILLRIRKTYAEIATPCTMRAAKMI